MSAGEFSIPDGYKLITSEELNILDREFRQWSKRIATFRQGWGEDDCVMEDFYSGCSCRKSFYKRTLEYVGTIHTLKHFIETRCKEAVIGKTQSQCLVKIMHPVKFGKWLCLVGKHPVGCCPFKNGWKWRARMRFKKHKKRSK